MTAPIVTSTPLGPGTLTIGPTGTSKEFAVQIQACELNPDKDKDDDVIMLSGDTAAGATTYKYTLSGTLRQDLDNPAGVSAYTWSHIGEELDFVFVPNTAAVASFAGKLIMDPTKVGGTDGGKAMTSDFEFSCVGAVTPTFGP